jgi:hypothetical protein
VCSWYSCGDIFFFFIKGFVLVEDFGDYFYMSFDMREEEEGSIE